MGMPAGRKLKTETEDGFDDVDDLDDILADLDEGSSTSDTRRMAKAAAKLVDKDDPVFNKDDADEDSADEADDEDADDKKDKSPAERLKDKKKKSGEEENEEDEDAEPEEEEDEESSGEDEEDEEEKAPPPKKSSTLGPSQKALAELGYANAAKVSENTAKIILAQHQLTQPTGQTQSDPLAEIGKAALEAIRSGKSFGLPTGQQEEKKPDEDETRKAKLAESQAAMKRVGELAERMKAMPKEPEFDPRWEAQCPFNGTMYVAPPNQPGLQAVADKLNAHMDWRLKTARAIQSDVPALAENLNAALQVVTLQQQTGGITADQVQEIIKNTREQAEVQEFLKVEVLGKNKSWMFAKDEDGQYVVNPATGFPYFTEEGMKYDRYVTMLKDRGMSDIRTIHHMAILLTGRDGPQAKSKKSEIDKELPGDKKGSAGKKKSQVELDDLDDDEDEIEARKADLKRKKKANATRVNSRRGGKAGISDDDDGDDAASAVKPVRKSAKQSLAEQLRAGLGKAGITDGSIRFGD